MNDAAVVESQQLHAALNSEAVEAYDAIADVYDEQYSDPVYRAEDLAVKALMQRREVISKPVLDVGCGTGKLLELMPYQPGYVGIDPSEGMLKVARRKFPQATFQQATLKDVPGLSVDSVVSLFCSLSHASDFEYECIQLARVLRPGGQAFLVLSGPGRLRRPQFPLAAVNKYLAPPVQMAADVHVALARAGLVDVEITGLCLCPDPILTAPPVDEYGLAAFLVEEALYLGRRWPDMGVYLVVEAAKP